MFDLHLSTDSFRQTLSDFQTAARTTVVQTDDSQVATKYTKHQESQRIEEKFKRAGSWGRSPDITDIRYSYKG